MCIGRSSNRIAILGDGEHARCLVLVISRSGGRCQAACDVLRTHSHIYATETALHTTFGRSVRCGCVWRQGARTESEAYHQLDVLKFRSGVVCNQAASAALMACSSSIPHWVWADISLTAAQLKKEICARVEAVVVFFMRSAPTWDNDAAFLRDRR
jgi:hypothetical protein